MYVSKDNLRSIVSDPKSNAVTGFSTGLVASIWPLSECEGMPLFIFRSESLGGFKTSYSTLQVALYYIVLLKNHVPPHDFTQEQWRRRTEIQCGRQMFLSALILAAKYLQDKNYSTSVWGKITGLDASEINRNERVFVTAIDYRLHITKETFQNWTQLVLDVCNHTQHSPPLNPCDMVRTKQCRLDWNRFVKSLNPPAIAHKALVNDDLKVLLQLDFSISVYEVPIDFQSPRTSEYSALHWEGVIEMHQMLRPASTSPRYPQVAQQTPRAILTYQPHSQFQHGLPTPPPSPRND
jgi:hypothetical protein